MAKYNAKLAQPQPAHAANTPTYAGEWAGEYIAAALFSGVTLDNGGITIKPNVKFKQTISTFTNVDSIRSASCEFTDTAAITLGEQVLEPLPFQQNMILCKEQFQNDWGAVSMGYSAFDKLPPKFSDFLIAHSSAEVSEFIETKIWQGALGVDSFVGFVPLFQTAGSGVIETTLPIAITAANVIAEMGRLVDDIPTAVYGKEDLHIYVSQNIARAYVRALGGFSVAATSNSGTDTKGTQWYTNGSLTFDGIKIFVTNGLGSSEMVAAQKSNLYFGTGLLNDTNVVKVIDMADIDGSQQVRVVMRFTAGVQFGIGSDIVLYKG
jgi:hypothetical protein